MSISARRSSALLTALFSALLVVLASTIPAQVAWAEEADEQGVIEEIIVTGTKREQSAQDVPIALTAISDEQLKRQFRTDILALGELSPGVALGQVAGFRAIAVVYSGEPGRILSWLLRILPLSC